MIPQWFEAVVPLVIITTLVSGMGALPAGVQHLTVGKPKPTGVDGFDRHVVLRDALLGEQKTA